MIATCNKICKQLNSQWTEINAELPTIIVKVHFIYSLYSPGMPEMLSPSSAIVGSGLGTKVALITDGRFSGATHGKYYW